MCSPLLREWQAGMHCDETTTLFLRYLGNSVKIAWAISAEFHAVLRCFLRCYALAEIPPHCKQRKNSVLSHERKNSVKYSANSVNAEIA